MPAVCSGGRPKPDPKVPRLGEGAFIVTEPAEELK